MKNTYITMLRNDHDIIEPALAHLCALMDDVILVDQQSDAGQREYIEALIQQGLPIRLIKYDEDGHYQEEICNLLARHVVNRAVEEDGWIFLADMDEFYGFKSREHMRHYLKTMNDHPLITFPRYNVVPHPYPDEGFNITGTHYKVTQKMELGKVAIRKAYFRQHPELWISKGGHNVLNEQQPGNNGIVSKNKYVREEPLYESEIPMYHFPLRSLAQAHLKTLQFTRAFDYLEKDKQGYYRFKSMAEKFEKHGIVAPWLNLMCVYYGPELVSRLERAEQGVSLDDLLADGQVEPINVENEIALRRLPISAPRLPTAQLIADFKRSLSQPAQKRVAPPLVLVGDRLLYQETVLHSLSASADVPRLRTALHSLERQLAQTVQQAEQVDTYNTLLHHQYHYWHMRFFNRLRWAWYRLRSVTPPELFDAVWYTQQYLQGSPRRIRRHPYIHYRVYGWQFGCRPNASFDLVAYVQAHPDVFTIGLDPLQHYIEHDQREGRALNTAV